MKKADSIFMCVALHVFPLLYLGLYQHFLSDSSLCDPRLRYVITMFVFPVLFGSLLCGFVLSGVKRQLYTAKTNIICLGIIIVIIAAIYATGYWMYLMNCKEALMMLNMLPAAWIVLLLQKLSKNA